MASGITTKAKKQNSAQTWAMITIFGVVIYVVVDIVLAFLRPDYSLLHNAESDYGRGPYSWLMDGNFLLRFVLSTALIKTICITFPKDSAIKKGCYWLAAWAIASGLLAFFADNPPGYPRLRSGSIHLLLAFVAFIGATVGMIVLSRRFSDIQPWHKAARLLIDITTLAVISLILLGLAGIKLDTPGGLYERVFLGSVLVWESVVAIKIISTKPTSRSLIL